MSCSSSEVGTLLGAVQWSDEGSYLKEIASKSQLPQLAKAIKGQYLNIGVPSLANPGLASTLLLISAGSCVRVTAQCVKFKEGRRVVPIGSKIVIPENYEGFFEILSEDGRAVKCIETVSELCKRFPDSCLVREPIKAFVSRADDVDVITEKCRCVQTGETLVLAGEVLSEAKNGKPQQRYLRCFDQNGHGIFMPFDSKGKFSAIAKEDNISGVHSIKNLLNKRLPLMVRLIHGKPPVGPKITQFLPELRLFSAFKEEALAGLPLGKESPIVLLPPSAPLKLTLPKNQDLIEKTKEFIKVRDRSLLLLKELSEKIQVYDMNVGNKSGNGIKDPRFHRLPDQQHQQNKHRVKNSHFHHRSQKIKTLSEKKILNTENNKIGTTNNDSTVSPTSKVDDYDEIDQIYDYVRGFAPLPKHIKPSFGNDRQPPSSKRLSVLSKCSNDNSIDSRPVPPPIETIPGRKISEAKSGINEKLSPSVHPALITAVLEKAERKSTERLVDYKKIDYKKLDYKKLDRADRKMHERKVEKRSHASSTDGKKNNVTPVISIPTSTTPAAALGAQKNCSTEGKNSGKLFIKAAQPKSNKSRIFRHKSSSPIKDAILDIVSGGPSHLGGIIPSLSMNHISSTGGQGNSPVTSSGNGVKKSPSPLFKMRYKSLTNLVMDFDTLDSSTSKNSTTDSCGSNAHRTKLPEKRSRKLPRPKSMTNLLFDPGVSNGFSGPCEANVLNGGNNARALLEAERKLRLEPGVYRHARDAPALIAATSRMLASQKKIGTLYL